MAMKIRITSGNKSELGKFVDRMTVAGFKFENCDTHKRRDGDTSFYSDVDFPDPRGTDLNEEGYCGFCGCGGSEDMPAYVEPERSLEREYVSLQRDEQDAQNLEVLITPSFDDDAESALIEKLGSERAERRIFQCATAVYRINFCPFCGNDLRQMNEQDNLGWSIGL